MNIHSLSRFLNYSREFGLRTAYGYIVKPYLHKRSALPAKHQAVKKYLYHWASAHTDISSYVNPTSGVAYPTGGDTIWICWLQGEKEMPDIIRLCYDSVKKMSGSKIVQLITFDNITDFVKIPASIELKVRNKEISLTHFADYLRILLLKTHGGLWLDASIYVSQPINFTPKNDSLYTIKMPKINDTYPSDYRWAVNMIGCSKDCLLFSLLEMLMRKYIEEHKSFIDFFLFDYLIAVLYDHNISIRNNIENIPYKKEWFYQLHNICNNAYDKNVYDTLMHKQAYHKLSWKTSYKITDQNGCRTFYSHLMDGKTSQI